MNTIVNHRLESRRYAPPHFQPSVARRFSRQRHALPQSPCSSEKKSGPRITQPSKGGSAWEVPSTSNHLKKPRRPDDVNTERSFQIEQIVVVSDNDFGCGPQCRGERRIVPFIAASPFAQWRRFDQSYLLQVPTQPCRRVVFGTLLPDYAQRGLPRF